MIRFVLPAALVLAFAPPAPAADIIDYAADPGRYDRFQSGFPASPVPTTASNFLGAGLDLSGVGWLAGSGRTGVTLIAPQFILGSAHNGFGVSTQVRFAGPAGLQSYTVDQVTRLNSVGLPGNPPSDLIVGRLSQSTAGQGLAPVAVGVTAGGAVAGQPLLVYGTNPNAPYSNSPHLGLGTVSQTVTGTAFGDGSNNYLYEYPQAPSTPGSAFLVGGDSGSPTLVRQGGQAVVLGTHYAIDSVTDPDTGVTTNYSYDVFLSEYQMQLAAATNYTVLFVPVPEPAGLLVAAGAALLAARRRQRAERA